MLALIVNIWPEIMFTGGGGGDGSSGGERVSRSSFTTTEREVGLIKLSIAVKRHTLRFLSGLSNSSTENGPYWAALH